MADGWRQGGSGKYARQTAVFLESMAVSLGMESGGRNPDAADQMRRAIASQDCDRRRTLEMFKLLNSDEDSSDEESEHLGPLHDATRKGAMDTCKHLVENLGFDIDSVAADGSGLTPLACAVSHGIVIAARYFISKGADLNKQDYKGFAPLHHAAKQGNEGMARLLISRGACVDLPSFKGTPLHVAASYGEYGVLQILLDHHANPNMVSADQCTPIAALLCAFSKKIMDEHVCLLCMKLLVKAGAGVNSTNPDTPLVIATSKGLTECVTYLLEAGADANIPLKHDGSTPIEIAVNTGRRNLVEILFPFTSPIKSVPEWSVEGLINHVKSRPSKGKSNASVEDRKAQLKLLGGEAVAKKDYAGAAKFYTEAIKLDPADATLYSNRSFCHLKIGENEDALSDADACIRLRPEWKKAYYRKGSALMSLKKYKEACDAFMDGLKLDPSDMDMQNSYGEAAQAMRKEHPAGSASSQD